MSVGVGQALAGSTHPGLTEHAPVHCMQYKNDPSIAAGPIGDDAEGDACGE